MEEKFPEVAIRRTNYVVKSIQKVNYENLAYHMDIPRKVGHRSTVKYAISTVAK